MPRTQATEAGNQPPRDFEVLPAIDLRAGRVVRLAEGDFAGRTCYGADPVEVAGRFAGPGRGGFISSISTAPETAPGARRR